jgi:hypothetical protein
VWKQRVLGLRPEEPEEGRPEEDAPQKLTDDRGLPHPLHYLAQQTPDEDQCRDLREEQKLRRRGCGAGCCECNGRNGNGKRRPSACN